MIMIFGLSWRKILRSKNTCLIERKSDPVTFRYYHRDRYCRKKVQRDDRIFLSRRKRTRKRGRFSSHSEMRSMSRTLKSLTRHRALTGGRPKTGLCPSQYSSATAHTYIYVYIYSTTTARASAHMYICMYTYISRPKT